MGPSPTGESGNRAVRVRSLFLVGSENRDKRLGGRVINLFISHVIMPAALYLGRLDTTYHDVVYVDHRPSSSLIRTITAPRRRKTTGYALKTSEGEDLVSFVSQVRMN